MFLLITFSTFQVLTPKFHSPFKVCKFIATHDIIYSMFYIGLGPRLVLVRHDIVPLEGRRV